MIFKKNITLEIAYILLSLCFAAVTVISFFADRIIFFVCLGAFLVCLVLCILKISSVRKNIAKIITGFGSHSIQASVLADMNIPVLICDSTGSVLWYNNRFREVLLNNQKDIYLENITATIEDFNISDALVSEFTGHYVNEKHFTAYSSSIKQNNSEIILNFFYDDTSVFRDAVNYKLSRPSVLLFTLDSYNEISSLLSDSARAEILASVYKIMEDFINETNGIFTRISNNDYLAIVEEQHISKIIEDKFRILDKIREVPCSEVPVTMSIGVGRGALSLYENHIQARKALDMAIGRGGDQAAIKMHSGYVFYGGVNRAIEKRSKVKSRIIASSLSDMIKKSDRVLIISHKNSDLDAIGASVGIHRICKICEVESRIVINKKTTMAASLYNKLISSDYDNCFINENDCLDYITDNTLLIILDCHTPELIENSDVLKYARKVVIIDHHRKMVNYINNADLSYHEPYSSSCCELVAELLQNLEKDDCKLTAMEAEAMLSGIMLDTNDFTFRTGSRTFEAASYLKQRGAEPTNAKLLFAIDMRTYKAKALLVSAAEVYKGCAVSISDSVPNDLRVVIPQAADDMLLIDGVNASIVAVNIDGQTIISARSLGKYNVQLIMERLGGGGHQTMAGVQLEAVPVPQIKKIVYDAIDGYLNENSQIALKS